MAAGALPDEARALMMQARALRQEQRMVEADTAIARAVQVAPHDPLVTFLFAQSRYELGHPAADLFARARNLWPDNRDILRNQALALASEGQGTAAEDLLVLALKDAPGWLDGQRVLASLRWTGASADAFDAGYARACDQEPDNQALWLGWFSAVAQIKDWDRAREVLARAQSALGETRNLLIARAFVATESGEDAAARDLFARLTDIKDDVLTLARIRFHLRHRQPQGAQDLALSLLGGPSATQAWSYLSVIWRLLGDPRWAWLDGDPPYTTLADVGLSAAEMSELAELLRAMHTATRPYAEQSVRGGTQTDRSVLLRHEPILQRARQALMATVADFVAALPAPDPRHPLLGRPRDNLRVSGSWSVRLGAGGFNVAHTHPMGWLSSAFYIAIPELGEQCPEPEGFLELGAPPPELGLDLPPYARLKPQPGKLAIFPSTMWHGTIPFSQGERLNIAFDIVPGGGG